MQRRTAGGVFVRPKEGTDSSVRSIRNRWLESKMRHGSEVREKTESTGRESIGCLRKIKSK